MKVGVYGLWHLGCVTAACLAKAGHQVLGLEPEPSNLERLGRGRAPLHEPGLDELIAAGLASGKLAFSGDLAAGLRGLDVLWITFDTPVDDEDRADVAYVTDRVKACLPLLDAGCLVLISSQLPVGSTLALQAEAERLRPGAGIRLAYSPENLRLGKALAVFQDPDRVVVGVSDATARDKAAALLKPITPRIEWMSVPSAEMTKHAINSFLALSVVFINELGVLCEAVGADAQEVERGLKTEQRIGPKAYLGAGAAFAGGTLARDLQFLGQLAAREGGDGAFFRGVLASNQAHQSWPLRKLRQVLGPLAGRRVGILGLAYKAGTSTLRRSQALALGRALLAEGAQVWAFDPWVKALEPGDAAIRLAEGPAALVAASEAVVLCMDWKGLDEALLPALAAPGGAKTVVDPAGALARLALPPGLSYHRVGGSGAAKAGA